MVQVSDYTALIPSANRDRPKFRAVIEALAQPWVDLQNQLASMPAAFDVEEAIGVQLDQVGQWAGLSRHIPTPLTGIYFTLDQEGLGFDQGVWKQPHDPDTGLTALDDDTFRLLLKVKIGANHWDGAPESLNRLLNAIFDSAIHAFVQDHGKMSITVGIAGQIPPAAFLALLIGGYLSLKPEGVRVRYVIVPSHRGNPLFGFDVQNQCIAGFDQSAWGQLIVRSVNDHPE